LQTFYFCVASNVFNCHLLACCAAIAAMNM
jgi:hypothetical protein